MKWILLLFWSLNGQPVVNHIGYENREVCEQRLLAMQKVFDVMEHPEWLGICQPANPG